MQAIILAGGRGRRLAPYTTVLPKPLMPIGDYPILEVILRQLESAGFSEIVISTGYLHELIRAYLDHRRHDRLSIRYTYETEPLGTIGPLRLVEALDEDFLVMNGDILTDLDFAALLDAHRSRRGLATIATYQRDVKVDFGVLEHDADYRITRFSEKPTYHFSVSMGVYAFSRDVLRLVPEGVPFGFDDLMRVLTERGEAVYSYPYGGYWLDIGRPDDYERSIEEFEKNKDRFLR